MGKLARQTALCVCVFAVHFFSEHEVLCGKNLQRNNDISYAKFARHLFQYLDVAKIGEYLVHEVIACAELCIQNFSCFSFNLEVLPGSSGHYRCELLASDKYNASDKFLLHANFSHYSIRTPCSEKPCKNGGTCIPLYNDDDFKCKCPAGFEGKECERGCPGGWTAHNFGCFLFVSTKRNWPQARANCQSIGGDLVVIDTAEKQQFIQGFLRTKVLSEFVWAGGYPDSGVWRWIKTNAPVDSGPTFWDSGEPDSYVTGYLCLDHRGSSLGKWHDCCNCNLHSVCEI